MSVCVCLYVRAFHSVVYTMSGKNIPDMFDCNLKKNYHILIFFDTNISDKTADQMTNFPLHSLSASALPGETK